MVAKHRSVPSSMHVVIAGISLVALVASLATFEWLDDQPRDDQPRRADTTVLDPTAGRDVLPVHEPDEWAFWDQMAWAFSTEPVAAGLLDRPGVVFRWWFDRIYVGGDVVPRDCGGITLWLGEFERYGFEAGADFVESRRGPCPLASDSGGRG